MTKDKLRIKIDQLEGQLAAMESSKRFWSWQAAYLPILEKQLLEYR